MSTLSWKARPGKLHKLAPAVSIGVALVVPSLTANGLVINATYDPSVSGAPSRFIAALQSAISFYQSTFMDPITVNINFGWGAVGGSPIFSGALGESETYFAGY